MSHTKREQLQHLLDSAYAAGQANAMHRFCDEMIHLKEANATRDALLSDDPKEHSHG